MASVISCGQISKIPFLDFLPHKQVKRGGLYFFLKSVLFSQVIEKAGFSFVRLLEFLPEALSRRIPALEVWSGLGDS